MGFGVLFLLILVSMIAAYSVDPSDINESKTNNKEPGGSERRVLEVLLMILLFIYLSTSESQENAVGGKLRVPILMGGSESSSRSFVPNHCHEFK